MKSIDYSKIINIDSGYEKSKVDFTYLRRYIKSITEPQKLTIEGKIDAENASKLTDLDMLY